MYEFDARIRYSEVGSDTKLKLITLLDYFQDASTFHSEDLGIGWNYLQKQDMVWVMSYWQVDIFRYADLAECVKVKTFPYDFKSCLGMRNFMMDTPEGERLAVANTLWTLLNTKTWGPAKPPAEMIEKYGLEPKVEMEYLPRKIVLKGQGEELAPVCVAKHHLDSNYHVNNVQYIAIASDYIPEDFPIKRIRASYHQQAHLNDLIYPVIYSQEEGVFGISLNDAEGKPYCMIEVS